MAGAVLSYVLWLALVLLKGGVMVIGGGLLLGAVLDLAYGRGEARDGSGTD